MSDSEELIKKFEEDFPLLIELGFIAVKYGNEEMSKNLFMCAETLNPESAAPKMGKAYIHLNKLELKEAIKLYQEVIEEEKDNQMARMFLGICHVLEKKDVEKGEKLIEEALANAEDDTVKNLGKTSLNWIKKEFKEQKGMFGM